MTVTNYLRGSEWRKWDLHIHAPGTKLNSQFGDEGDAETWDVYCRTLHQSDVCAFGIADYFSADGYHRVVAEYRARFEDCPKLFIPNIELRLNEVVNSQNEEVHTHILFNPKNPKLDQHLSQFLYELLTTRTDTFGRSIRTSDLSTPAEFASATTTRQFILDALNTVFGAQADQLDCCLIITAANNDGIRAQKGSQRKALITDEIDKFSDAFFGSASNKAYFLRLDRAEAPCVRIVVA